MSIEQIIPLLSGHGPLVVLESQSNTHRESHHHFVAAKPKGEIKLVGDHCWVTGSLYHLLKMRFPNFLWSRDGSSLWYVAKLETPSMIWALLSAVQEQRWLFGYLGYDLKNAVEQLESSHMALNRAPDLWFMEPEILIKFDTNSHSHPSNSSGVEKNSTQWILGNESMIPVTTEKRENEGNNREASFRFNPKKISNKDEYLEKVRRIQNDIHEGSYYEMNLSHALQFDFEGSAWKLYQAMKAQGPVPFGAYLELLDSNGQALYVCCASPERYLAKRGSSIWSEPIKGTVGRSDDELMTVPERVRVELLSEKNKAEHLMIVDLVRNDLHRVAKSGSMKVDPLFEIQSFETVYQLVSKVIAEVGPEVTPVEIIRNSFPMGSMTGAPKIAAMKAIETYEDYKRGIYSGAIGYFSPSGDFDFNVVIRTALIQDQQMVYPVGGAITSDSSPEAEWEETLVKAEALHRALNAMP